MLAHTSSGSGLAPCWRNRQLVQHGIRVMQLYQLHLAEGPVLPQASDDSMPATDPLGGRLIMAKGIQLLQPSTRRLLP